MGDKIEMGDFQTAQTLETFGFLPRFSQAEVYDQIEYLIRQGWTPSIEHEHPSQSANSYWTMWKLPPGKESPYMQAAYKPLFATDWEEM